MKQSNSRNSAFQLTASQGGWPHLAGWPLSVPYFNSQPHKEADYEWAVFVFTFHHFNSQPHKEADVGRLKTQNQRRSYFNSQPHKEADSRIRNRPKHIRISTHSLTRRLTNLMEKVSSMSLISTHSLTRRLTNFHDMNLDWLIISTHSLTRRLTNFHDMNLDCLIISTHSLTRRLTSYHFRMRHLEIISTHSLTRRLTTTMGTGNMDLVQFQLTASQGGWHLRFKSKSFTKRISTHSLTRRLTSTSFLIFRNTGISTHSLTRRLTGSILL